MAVFKRRIRPEPWSRHRQRAKHPWLVPLYAFEWGWSWLAYWLSGWAFLEVLEYLGTLSLLLAVISYFSESGDRLKQKHYQAWQVINTAQGKGGSGGRLEAMQELNHDGVPLVGVDVSGAFLQSIRLPNARLRRSDFSAADVRNSDLEAADLQDSNLHSANFRQSNFREASLTGAQMDDADFSGADFSKANLSGTVLDNADLRLASLKDSNWNDIRSIKGANLYGLHDAPAGFIDWALKQGAVQMQSDDQWENWRQAQKQ